MAESNRNVALAADYQYINNVTATLKSLLFNNSEINIYLLNSDIPQEWFAGINEKINTIGSRLIDVKVDPDLLKDEHLSMDFLSPITYGKLIIPQFVDADHVVYLDSDTIVDADIDELFNFHFREGKLYAAVKEMENDAFFNAGVLVANNKELRKINGLVDQLLKLGNNGNLNNSDQSVFNDYFAGKIEELPLTFNYEAGMDRWASYQSRTDMLAKLNSLDHPKIIHYVTDDKPWNLMSSSRGRDKWWHYFMMDWATISNKYLSVTSTIPSRKVKGSFFTFTHAQEIAQLDRLARDLPEYDFNIAAYTKVGFELVKAQQYPNVHVYRLVSGYNLDRLIKNTDAYLDINYFAKEDDIIKKYLQTGKPVYTLPEVSSHWDDDNYYEFANVVDLENAIKKI